jgi:hypothetical protein
MGSKNATLANRRKGEEVGLFTYRLYDRFVGVLNEQDTRTFHDKWVPVTTAWRVLRLRMEERPPVMEGSCEYFE